MQNLMKTFAVIYVIKLVCFLNWSLIIYQEVVDWLSDENYAIAYQLHSLIEESSNEFISHFFFWYQYFT